MSKEFQRGRSKAIRGFEGKWDPPSSKVSTAGSFALTELPDALLRALGAVLVNPTPADEVVALLREVATAPRPAVELVEPVGGRAPAEGAGADTAVRGIEGRPADQAF